MASLWKHPNSSFWTACYTDRDGRQVKRSTKQADKKKALLIAVEYERLETVARKSGVNTRQMQKVLNDMLEKTNEETIKTPTAEKYLRDWLKTIEAKKSAGTYERYKHTVDLFLGSLGATAKSPITSISSSHIEDFLNARLKDGVASKTAVVDIKTLNVAFHRAERYAVILKNPVIPIAAGDFAGTAIKFFGFKLRPQGARLDGFAGIVRPEAGGFVASCAVGVNELNKPKRRVLLFVNGCHSTMQFVQ